MLSFYYKHVQSEIIDSMVQLDIDRIQSSLVIVSPFTDPGSTQPSTIVLKEQIQCMVSIAENICWYNK